MTRPNLLLRLAGAALPAALLLLAAPPARAQNVYPRLALYCLIPHDGYPFVDSTGTLDPVTISQVARYEEIVLSASPVTEYHPEILAALRAQNPRFKALAYVTGEDVYPVNDADSLVHFPTRYYHMVRDLDGLLYNRGGGLYGSYRVNLAKRDAQGHLIVAESIADLFYNAIVSTGIWDGMFVDLYCDDIGWTQSPAESIDYVRAGYTDQGTFLQSYSAGADTLASRLRRLCGSSTILVGNCGQGTRYALFNGWMRENFPYQNGATWYENMFRAVGGYFTDDASFRQPTNNFIFTMVGGLFPYTADNLRKERFGLASATLGEGFGVFGPGDSYVMDAPFYQWWFDEYAVDLSTGRASGLLQDTDWLGAALGPWYQMIWVGTNPDAVSNPDFETSVTDGWTFYVDPAVSASLTRDATTAGHGASSARVTILRAGTVNWHVTYGSSGSIPLYTGQNYAATFWARASSPRRIMVVAGSTGYSGPYRYVDVGTDWKQYQVALVPQSPGTGKLMFFLGLDAGDVWIDDAHLQAGASALYRRDFLNGSVLVNPSSQSLTVPLGGTWRHILGTVDPVTNDGASVTDETVPPSDARFLLRRDLIPPAAVRDLRLQH